MRLARLDNSGWLKAQPVVGSLGDTMDGKPEVED